MLLDMVTATPPFDVENAIEDVQYWIKPDGRTPEQRAKKLRSEICSALITLMGYINDVRPRLLVGLGQGGIVVAMS